MINICYRHVIIPLDKASEKVSVLIKDTQPVRRKARKRTIFFYFLITSLAFYKVFRLKNKNCCPFGPEEIINTHGDLQVI